MRYIKSLSVRGFQSHALSHLDFSRGLNVITGATDHGKSALIRALRWALYNEPRGGDFVRAGADTCQVTITLDDGTSIIRERTAAGRNRYLLRRPNSHEQVFEGFGVQVPLEVAQASGVNKVDIDEESSVEMNLGAQLEGPFLLQEKPSVRAKVIGKLGGVHILDVAQRNTVRELRRLREEQTDTEQELSALEKEISAYAYLPQYEQRIGKAQEKLDELENKAAQIGLLYSLKEEWLQTETSLTAVRLTLEKLSQLPLLEAELQTVEQNFVTYQELINMACEFGEMNRRIAHLGSIIRRTQGLEQADASIIRMEAAARELKIKTELLAELDDLTRKKEIIEQTMSQTANIAQAEQKLAVVEDGPQKIRHLQELKQELENTSQKLSACYRSIENSENQSAELLAQYQKVLFQLGRCPMCLAPINSETMDRIIKDLTDERC